MFIVIIKLKQLFAHISVRTKRGPKCWSSHPSLAISRKKLLILSFIMFISLKLEQMINFVLSVSLKRRAKKKDKR